MERLVETACLNDSAEYLKWASSIAKESAEQPKRKFLMFAGKFPEGTKISIEDIDKHFPDELSKIITTIHQLINDAQTPDSEFQIHTHPEEKSVSIKRHSVKRDELEHFIKTNTYIGNTRRILLKGAEYPLETGFNLKQVAKDCNIKYSQMLYCNMVSSVITKRFSDKGILLIHKGRGDFIFRKKKQIGEMDSGAQPEIKKTIEFSEKRTPKELEETVMTQKTAPQKQITTRRGALMETSEWKQFERLFVSSRIHKDIIMFIGTKAAGRNITTKKDLSEFLTQRRSYNKIYTPRQLENVINLFFENISVKYGNGRFKITMDSDGNISVEIDPKIAAIDTPKKTEQIVSISCGRTPDAITQKQPLKTQPGYEEWVDSVAQKDSQNKAAYRHILTHIGEYPPETTVYMEDIGKSLKKANIVSTISDTALKFYIIHLLSRLKEDRGTFTVTDKRESGTIQGYLIYRTEESQRREKNNRAAATKITAKAKKKHKPLSETTQSFLKWRDKNQRAQIKPNKNDDMFNDEYDDLKPLNFDFDIDEETGEK